MRNERHARLAVEAEIRAHSELALTGDLLAELKRELAIVTAERDCDASLAAEVEAARSDAASSLAAVEAVEERVRAEDATEQAREEAEVVTLTLAVDCALAETAEVLQSGRDRAAPVNSEELDDVRNSLSAVAVSAAAAARRMDGLVGRLRLLERQGRLFS